MQGPDPRSRKENPLMKLTRIERPWYNTQPRVSTPSAFDRQDPLLSQWNSEQWPDLDTSASKRKSPTSLSFKGRRDNNASPFQFRKGVRPRRARSLAVNACGKVMTESCSHLWRLARAWAHICGYLGEIWLPCCCVDGSYEGRLLIRWGM